MHVLLSGFAASHVPVSSVRIDPERFTILIRKSLPGSGMLPIDTIDVHPMNQFSIHTLLTPRPASCCPGLCFGLPFALTGATLQAMVDEAGLDLTTIGLFAYVGTSPIR